MHLGGRLDVALPGGANECPARGDRFREPVQYATSLSLL